MVLAGLLFSSLLMFGSAAELPTTDELSTVYNNLKAADESKDQAAILKWAAESSRLSKAVIAEPVPSDSDEAVLHKTRVDFAKQISTYVDYALSSAALRASDNPSRIEIFETLQKANPSSQYLPRLFATYVGALAKSGRQNEVFPFAEKAIGKDPRNPDLLLILADGAMARKQWERAANFGAELASVIVNQSRPEGMSAGDWERRRAIMAGRGYWIAGISFATVNKYPQADKNLRAALPFVKAETSMYAPALFYLGVANYNLARAMHNRALMNEAVQFSQQCAAIPGTYQQQAYTNVTAMKQEAARIR